MSIPEGLIMNNDYKELYNHGFNHGSIYSLFLFEFQNNKKYKKSNTKPFQKDDFPVDVSNQ